MRKIYPFLKLVFVLLITGPLSAQTTDLIISEYAEGSSFNKYIEIYNGTGAPVNLTDYEIWRISNGGTWPEASSGLTGTLANDSTLVIANGQADPTILNLPNAVVDGILSHNGDDAIGLAKDDGTNNFFLIDAVGSSGADPGSGWDVAGTTNGTANHTLVRKDSVCSPDTNWSVTAGTSASTSQWIVYPSDTWTYVGSHTSTCSGGNPTPPSTPFYNIADINNVDANGVADSLGVECFTQGLVMGVDLNSGSGYSFTLWDGEGIGVFNFSDVNGYTVQEGDSIIIKGEVDQFNGLTQLGSIDSISVVNTGNPLPSPTVITSLDESTESELVRFDNAEITADLGFGNWEVVSGMDTITMRIEDETNVDDSVSVAVGDSLCYIIGIGGQFDNNSPYTEGYQMIPRYFADIDTTCGGSTNPPAPTGTPFYNIADINNVDANGVADSLGVECFTKGVVLGVNLRNSGYQFTLWDNEGIGVFNFSDVNGYTVQEGDSIIIKGEVDQFNGLTQIGSIDSIHVVNSGNPLPSPSVVTSLDESTESEPIQINNVLVTGVSGSNFDIVNATDTMTMRIDTETGIFNDITPAVGDSLCSVVGIGGQFDGSSPYTSGYQIFPMYSSDLDTTCGGNTNPPAPVELNIYPIGDVTTVDANGEPDSLGVVCGVQGVVTTIDFRVGGYSLYIQDATGGINVFSFNDYNNVQPLMGDSLLVWGEIDQYNGLTEIIVDSLEVINTGNTIPNHQLVTSLDESVESILVELEDYIVTDLDSQNVGPAINYTIANGTDSFELRVLDITGINDMMTMVPGDTLCSAKGVVSQFDRNAPYIDNYQLQPVQISDLTVNNCDTVTSVDEVANQAELRAYPNPTNNMLNFNKTIDFVMFNALGEEVKRATRVRRINVSDLTNGIYFIKSEESVLKVIVK